MDGAWGYSARARARRPKLTRSSPPQGTAFGGYKGRTDVPKLADMYSRGELKLDEFVTHEFKGIASLHAAFDAMHHGALRPVITL